MTGKAKILIVDDEKIWRDQLTEILEKSGYEVVTTDRGDSAIEMIKKDNFHLVIADIRMESELKGLDVLKHVKKVSPKTPVIMLTAYGTGQTAKESLKKGAFGFFVKGEKDSSNEEIRKKVADALGENIL